MTAPSAVSLAYFGKLASRGDFVRSSRQGVLTQRLDEWLSRGLERAAADPRWKQRYDQLGPSRFAFLGVRSRVALAGYLVPNVDASGRRFPFVMAGSFGVAAPQAFMSQAPMALDRLWAQLESMVREACGADDATEALGRAASARLEIDTRPDAGSASLDGFLQAHTVGSLEALLRTSHPHLELRRTLLALGLLLRPVRGSGMSRLDRGLALPLPGDAADVPAISALWMDLVTPFLARGDFELALFVLRAGAGRGAQLCIGFCGGSPAALHAVFDAGQRDEAFVDVLDADWVDNHLLDPSVRKLSSYLMQPRLSVSLAVRTFKECFLGE